MYPTWRYHRTRPACIVKDPAADAALGEGWTDTPAPFLNPAADCCATAASSRGYRHTDECTFGEPEPAAPAKKKK